MAKTLSLSKTLATLALCLTLGLARAQDTESYESDPPDRAARLSYLEGDVSLQPAGEEAWAPAVLNRPLTTGDELWTESGARAEIQVGPATVRLDGSTGFSFLNVDDDTIQMRMAEGVINVRVRSLAENDHIEIDTPNVALSLLRPGSYRVEVKGTGDSTVVKVLEGEAEASGPSHEVLVHNQQVVTFRGDDPLDAQYSRLGGPDEFDSWSLERDRRDDRVASSQTSEYVSPDVTGYEDLNDNGRWSSEPEYGYVWTPNHVVAGWAPYQYGRWAWISPWGWTWIDDAPWGYAPFHYGRWAYTRNRWCWVPGPRHVRAVYAPALVGWVGSPGSVNVSLGDGGVAWFPLAPYEVYVPARRYSAHYVERVNASNTVIRERFNDVYRGHANASYRNRAVPGAVMVVPRTAFTSSERVSNHRVGINQSDILRARVTATAPRIEPVRESRLGGTSRSWVRVPPRPVAERQVIVKRDPPPADAHFVRAPRAAVERSSQPQVPADRPRADRPAVEIDRQLRQQQAREQQASREAQFQQRRQQEDAQREQRRQQEASQRQQWEQHQAARDQQREMQDRVQQQVERHQRQEAERRAAPPPQPARQERAPDPPRTEQRSSESKTQAPKQEREHPRFRKD